VGSDQPKKHDSVMKIRDTPGRNHLSHGEPLAPAAEGVGEHDGLQEHHEVVPMGEEGTHDDPGLHLTNQCLRTGPIMDLYGEVHDLLVDGEALPH